ncbi:MAG: flagellar basal body rod protein FlgC [Phycisphaerales bacterium]|nr:flagellar basal body rod protein FlgC [Phycisphaerales bacterium]
MMDVFGIALSGMQAAQTQLNVAANNIANGDTPGYQSRRADLVELSTGGVGVAGFTTDTASADPKAGGTKGSNVDLATQLVNVRQAQTLYAANAMVVRAADRMTGSLLNILDTHDHGHHGDQN